MRSTIAALVLVSGIAVTGLEAQTGVVRFEDTLRFEPAGAVIGSVLPGTRVMIGEQRGDWTEVALQGFVYITSLQVWPDPILDLVVSAPDGENLRDEPSGRVAGRFESQTLLEELRRIPGWIEIRRNAWVRSASIDVGTIASRAPTAESFSVAEPEAPEAPEAPEPEPVVLDGLDSAVPDILRSAAGVAPILTAPDGDTLARATAGSDLRVLRREGNWARVSIEGWVWVPGLSDPGNGSVGNGDVVLSGMPADELARNPDGFLGRLIEIELQFVSVERAEQLRSDFYEGEPFLLTRSLGAGRIFVYVAIPPERLPEAEAFEPLETLRILARVRSGAAAFTGSPVLDLVEVERIR